MTPAGDLQDKSQRPYVAQGLALGAGQAGLSLLEPNQERGRIERPVIPVFRAVSPVVAGGRTIGLIVANVDARWVLGSLRSSLYPTSRVYIVMGTGDFAVNPDDPAGVFSRALLPPGSAAPAPAWTERLGIDPSAVAAGRSATMLVKGRQGARGVALVPTDLAPEVRIVETAPRDELVAGMADAYRASLGIPALAAAGVLAVGLMMTRRLARQVDQTARANVELATQRANERRYVAVIESSADAVLTLDPAGRISSFNRAAEELYGYPSAAVLGRPVDILVPPERRAELAGLRRRAEAGERLTVESQRRHRSGRLVDVSLSLSPILDAAGRPVGIAKIARDITARNEAEERFRLVVEQSPSGVCVVDRAGRIELVNRQMETMFGYARAELLGMGVEALLPNRVREQHASLRDGYCAAPTSRPMGQGRDLFGRRKDGSELVAEIGLSPIRIRGELSTLCLIVDVTERKEAADRLAAYADQLERSNADLQRFAHVISHDLRAPLRGIATVAEWLERDFGPVVDADARENLQLMRDRIDRLGRLIVGILEYSRVGSVVADRSLVRVEAVVADVLASIEVSAGVSVEIGGPLPDVVYNEIQLRQVFQNLVVNALTHGGPALRRVMISGDRKPDAVRFAVRDDGQGIPERHFERIFGLFQTLRPQGPGGSTGAGLAIVKRIVEDNGGAIVVESREGEGATFTFSVPGQPMPGQLPVRSESPDEKDLPHAT